MPRNFTASEIQILTTGLNRLTVDDLQQDFPNTMLDMAKAALKKVDNFTEQKKSILSKLEKMSATKCITKE